MRLARLGLAGGMVAAAGLVLLPMMFAVGAGNTPTSQVCSVPQDCVLQNGWAAGNIISDTVFNDAQSMTVGAVRNFIAQQGRDCNAAPCLRNFRVTVPATPGDRDCTAIPGGADRDTAEVIVAVSVACGINPQVMLVTLQKESQLLTRADATNATYTAAWGYACPDKGPGGTASCDPAFAGFFEQAYGMAKQFARYRLNPGNYTYRPGQTADIPWNVAESGCGTGSVTIQNAATASLYNYTPYQPNAASIAAYPGEGDKCSSYGNRNFFYLFQEYFGPTGGGTTPTPPDNAEAVEVNGITVTIPNRPDVATGAAGQTITAPNAAVARGIAAGLATVGLPYVWGGGTNGYGPDQGCARGGGSLNSCQGILGLDCSGLTAYVLAQAGFRIPGNSAGQRAAGMSVPRAAALPGDIVGFPGHVALYLGRIDGNEYFLEAPEPGRNIAVHRAYWTSNGSPADTFVHRYWS